jgi:signal peptidase II
MEVITASGGSLKKHLENYAFLWMIAGIIVALDQSTKALVRANLAIEEFWAPWDWLEPYARIVHWKNTGAAFGMLPGFSDVFTVLAIIVSLAILYYFPQVPREDWPLRLAMGLQLGGALGNLIDRVTIGYVVDFVSVGNFPVFNVADASISTGVAVLILGVWIKERRDRSSKSPEDPGASTEKAGDRVPEETWGE